ncbi:ras family-domain-containing protein [Gongronella butleri]|nr:ras family-domain-containing protein [Gongronella butleri]
MSSSNHDNNDTENPQFQLKLVILGESAVGKTSFLHQFINHTFVDKREPTVGAGFLTRTLPAEDRCIKFNVWDTAGQERFHSLAPMYYRGAQAAIVMYDVTKESTFQRAKMWVRELQRQAPANIVITLVGNKIDLCDDDENTTNDDVDEQRQISSDDAERYARESALLFFETSAKNNINVDKVFSEIARNVPVECLTPMRPPGGKSSQRNDHDRVDLSQPANASNTTKSASGCAC